MVFLVELTFGDPDAFTVKPFWALYLDEFPYLVNDTEEYSSGGTVFFECCGIVPISFPAAEPNFIVFVQFYWH